MGVVWKARQSSLNRDVALKMIRAGALAGPEEVARFLREAEAAANLQHPNIVAIHEVGEHGGQHYFSMDYVVGRDLGALVKDGPLSPQRAAGYVKMIAEAIQFAHQRGTLHRDLKPQNVLIDADDRPRITDFGLAKIMTDDSRLTQSGVVMGSPSYMPPEQAAGRHGDIGPASDVYSLGAMLYELLTGQPPFRGATAMATLHDVLESEPVAPRKLKADIPPDLETICLKCLEKSPSARYPTARALADELGRFLSGEPIQARPASALRKCVSWARRHPGALAAVAAIVMVALAFSIFYLFEENAFLRARNANPALERIPGKLHESVQMWSMICIFSFEAGAVVYFVVRRRARGLRTLKASLKELFDQSQFLLPRQPLGERTRTFAFVTGLILVGCGVMLLASTVRAYVWEGESVWGQIGMIYLPIYIGLVMFHSVVHDYRLVHYGTSSRQLTAEQIEPIRNAMEGWNVQAAIRHYRKAVPDAGALEATRYVTHLADSLKAQHPGKFVPAPLSLAKLNWQLVGITALIEAVAVCVLWLVVPTLHSASAVTLFACSFLAGMAFMTGLRVRDTWKRVLLLVPFFAGMCVAPILAAAWSVSSGPWWCGVVFGMFLMVSAFTPRRKVN